MPITNATKTGQFIDSLSKKDKMGQMIRNVAMGDGKPSDFIDAYKEIRSSERREDIEKVKSHQRQHMFKAGEYTLDFDQVMKGPSASDEPAPDQVTIPDDVPNAHDQIEKERNVLTKYMSNLDRAIQSRFSSADAKMEQG